VFAIGHMGRPDAIRDEHIAVLAPSAAVDCGHEIALTNDADVAASASVVLRFVLFSLTSALAVSVLTMSSVSSATVDSASNLHQSRPNCLLAHNRAYRSLVRIATNL
jgi:hypothetical protein